VNEITGIVWLKKSLSVGARSATEAIEKSTVNLASGAMPGHAISPTYDQEPAAESDPETIGDLFGVPMKASSSRFSAPARADAGSSESIVAGRKPPAQRTEKHRLRPANKL
jgi:hypothetical protein